VEGDRNGTAPRVERCQQERNKQMIIAIICLLVSLRADEVPTPSNHSSLVRAGMLVGSVDEWMM